MSAVHNSGAPHRLLWSRLLRAAAKASENREIHRHIKIPFVAHESAPHSPLASSPLHQSAFTFAKARRAEEARKSASHRFALLCGIAAQWRARITSHSNTFQYISKHCISFHCIGRWFWRIGCFPRKWEWEWILDLGGRVEAIEEAACRGWLWRPPSPWQPPLHAACKRCRSSLLEVRIAMPQWHI